MNARRGSVRHRSGLAAAGALALAIAAGSSGAAEDSSATAGYEVQAQVIGAGGARLSGANGLALDASVGQGNATTLTGANGLGLSSGFWSVQVQGKSDRVFANGFETSGP